MFLSCGNPKAFLLSSLYHDETKADIVRQMFNYSKSTCFANRYRSFLRQQSGRASIDEVRARQSKQYVHSDQSTRLDWKLVVICSISLLIGRTFYNIFLKPVGYTCIFFTTSSCFFFCMLFASFLRGFHVAPGNLRGKNISSLFPPSNTTNM